MKNVQRHPNGCIDFDFYRAQGHEMRREAMRETGLRVASAARAVMAGALGFAVVIPPDVGAAGRALAAAHSGPPKLIGRGGQN